MSKITRELIDKTPASRQLLNLTKRLLEDCERECAQHEARVLEEAEDWFTLAPSYRTKEALLAKLRAAFGHD